MPCPVCGQRVRKQDTYCPRCGQRLDQPQAAPAQQTAESTYAWGEAYAEAPARRGCGLSLAVVLVALLVMVGILGLGAAGVYYGLQDRARVERQAAEEHYNKGLVHLEQGEYEWGIAEFEFVVRLDPKHERAANQLAEARQKLAARPTPTTVPKVQASEIYWNQLRAAHAQGDWQKVVELADQLRALDPNAQRSEVDSMLFDAYYNSALHLIAENRLEEATRLLDRALVIQPNNLSVARERQLATLYLSAMGYWNADWAKVIEALAALHKQAPAYKDVRQRLYDAYVNYGNQLAERREWCSAETQYARALEIAANAAITAKRQESQRQCSTAAAPATPAPKGPSAPAGAFVGRVVEFINIDGDRILIRGRVLDRQGHGVGGQGVQIRAYTFSAVAVTDGVGQFSFDGLTTAVTYTLTLLDRPSVPVDAPGIFGKLTWVHFEEGK